MAKRTLDIPSKLMRQFEIACATLGISKHEGATRGIELFLKENAGAIEAAKKKSILEIQEALRET